MDILARIFGGDRLHAGTPGPTDDYWYRGVGLMSQSGIRVDAEQAQKISAWYRGRDLLATTLAMLPFPLYERLPNDGGAVPARQNPLYDVLHDEPNALQDSFGWRRQLMYHLIDHGAAYCRIVPGARGFVDQLKPIHPSRVRPELLDSERVVFHVRDRRTNQTTVATQDEVFFLLGATDEEVTPKGVLEYACDNVGLALATESYAARIFSNGFVNAGLISVPGTLDSDASKRMATSFKTAMGDWHLPKVLEQGASWTPQGEMTPDKAQMLLSREFSVDDIARWLGVPRQMLMNSDPSFGNAEQFRQDFIDFSMGPWLALFEFAAKRQLILNPTRFYAEFTRDAIVRGDLTARWVAHVNAVNAGIKSVDEVRVKENLNRRGGKADQLREPQNITGKPIAPPAPPSAPPKGGPGNRAAAIAAAADAIEPATVLQLEAIAQASAARLLRKEVTFVRKAAVRHAADEDAFVQAVTEFYAAHAELVSIGLQMPLAAAQRYCAGQAHQIVNGQWLAALDLWQTSAYAAGLAAIALEEAA